MLTPSAGCSSQTMGLIAPSLAAVVRLRGSGCVYPERNARLSDIGCRQLLGVSYWALASSAGLDVRLAAPEYGSSVAPNLKLDQLSASISDGTHDTPGGGGFEKALSLNFKHVFKQLKVVLAGHL